MFLIELDLIEGNWKSYDLNVFLSALKVSDNVAIKKMLIRAAVAESVTAKSPSICEGLVSKFAFKEKTKFNISAATQRAPKVKSVRLTVLALGVEMIS